MDDKTSKTNFGSDKASRERDFAKEDFPIKGGKGKKGKRKGKKKGEWSRSISRGTKFNDLSWYMKNPTIAEAYAKIPFNYIVGNKPAGARVAGINMTLPAMSSIGIDWVASVTDVDGSKVSNRDILNEVATIIYTNMRRHNSGSTNDIEYVDVITSNLLAGIDILVNVTCAQRVFKIANSFSWKNRLIPRYLFQLLGIDYDDFISNQANYRGKLNTIIAEARTIKVLNNYPFVNAIIAEFENVFKDADTDTGREQLLITVKPFHHIYDAVGTASFPGGSVRILQSQDIVSSFATLPAGGSPVMTMGVLFNRIGENDAIKTRSFQTDLDIIQAQLNALITDSDFNLIQADIEKAFGEQGSYIVADTVTSDEHMSPIYSGEFWTMVHNGVFLPLPDHASEAYSIDNVHKIPVLIPRSYVNSIHQYHESATGKVKLASHWHYFPFMTSNPSTQYATIQGICDSDKDDPSVEDVICMTRYKTIFTGIDKNNLPTDFKPASNITATYGLQREAGSNFVCFGGVSINMFFKSTAQTGTIMMSTWTNYAMDTGADDRLSYLPLIGFEHRPIKWVRLREQVGDIDEVIGIMNDIGNVRVLTIDELFNLQEGAFLSLWSLPEMTNI